MQTHRERLQIWNSTGDELELADNLTVIFPKTPFEAMTLIAARRSRKINGAASSELCAAAKALVSVPHRRFANAPHAFRLAG